MALVEMTITQPSDLDVTKNNNYLSDVYEQLPSSSNIHSL